ncbi:hypothetical protein LCGC14_2266890 [marine sediment metagenome]|uniref:Uncharacterized protein n=1 Tax=marine sediment metagenome TaxID=412755 RepID=A0A0F9FAG9_9ZZZZ
MEKGTTTRYHSGAYHRGEKKCTRCGETKSGDQFDIRIAKRGDKEYPYLSPMCIPCRREYYREKKYSSDYYRRNKEKIRNQHHARKKKGGLEYRVRIALASYRRRSKKSGQPCDLDMGYLLSLLEDQKHKCYYSGRRMKDLSDGIPHPQVMSLDRVDPNKGYIRGNVVWCCYAVNIMKQRMSSEELRGWCKDVLAT